MGVPLIDTEVTLNDIFNVYPTAVLRSATSIEDAGTLLTTVVATKEGKKNMSLTVAVMAPVQIIADFNILILLMILYYYKMLYKFLGLIKIILLLCVSLVITTSKNFGII